MTNQRFTFYYALGAVIGLASYQLFLCFLNTRFMGINNTIVIFAEGLILCAVTLKVLPGKKLTDFAIPAFIAAYLLLLTALRGQFDPQAMRNLYIIYIMFCLGRQIADVKDINRIIWALSGIVIAFGLWEYFYIEIYLTYFNILSYYNARGMVSEEQLGYLTNNLWISGMRPGGRTILPFLGDQRVSSLFIEPVSMGNYAAIVCMWALSFDAKDWRKSIGHFIAGVLFIIACDSRFASAIIVLLCIIRLMPIAQKQWLLFPLPLIAALSLAYFASLRIANEYNDDMLGRLARTGNVLLNMQLSDLFGLGQVDKLYDMGIPYSLVIFGFALCALLWLVFILLRFPTAQGTRMRAMIAVYCIGLLTISGTSFYSSKTSGILWLILGALYAQQKTRPAAATPYAQNATIP